MISSRYNSIKSTLVMVILTSFILAGCAPAAAAPTPVPAPTTAPATAAPAAAPTAAPAVIPTAAPAAAAPADITLTDGLNHTLTLNGPAQHILSLAPSNTEILYAIGAGKQVVGRDSLSDVPVEAKQLPDVGGGFGAINSELVVSLKPDLVLAAELTPPDQVKALQDVGLKVFLLKNPHTLDEMYQNLVTVAKLSGHEAQTAELIAGLKQRVAAVEAKIANVKTQPKVFYELDDSTDVNSPWTSGPGTFIDTLLKMAGATNLGNIMKSDWGQIPLEQLIVQDPDYILLGDYTYGGITPDKVAARKGWEKLSALQKKQVFIIDDNTISRPGPRMIDGLETLAKLLHPEVFK